MSNIDKEIQLAQLIRQVDGNNRLDSMDMALALSSEVFDANGEVSRRTQQLANFLYQVNADKRMGAARLAEKIVEWVSQNRPDPVESEPIVALYKNWKGETRRRSIIPMSVRFGSTEWHQEPQFLLDAFDTEKGVTRAFALRDFNFTRSLQERVRPWLIECFGEAVAYNKTERNERFLEEALELVQSLGMTQEDAHKLVDYVFSRPVGDPPQEVGGVRITLSSLCLPNDMDEDACAEAELERIWGDIPKIQAKQATKPKNSPLPGKAPE